MGRVNHGKEEHLTVLWVPSLSDGSIPHPQAFVCRQREGCLIHLPCQTVLILWLGQDLKQALPGAWAASQDAFQHI